VHSAADLLDAAKALDGCPIPRGPGVAVLSGQAGPGLAACDVCEARGLEIVKFHHVTQAAIDGLLPPLALRTNPVDMGPAWYDSKATCGIIEAALGDPNVAGVILLIMFASANVEMLHGLHDFLVGYHQEKPVVSCILAPPGLWDEEVYRLEKSGALVNFETPERAASAMARLWEYRHIRHG
jgi:acyl-CoA synthetase (NDP forming)